MGDLYYDKKYPGLSEAINDCYPMHMDVMGVLFHFSELLSGHEREAMDHTLDEYGDELPFCYEDCRILVTGIPTQIYHDIFGWRQPDAMAFFTLEYKPLADELMEKYGYRGISLIYLFDGKKRLVTIFSPKGEGRPGEVVAMAEELTARLQARYQEKLLGKSREYCTFTALSDPIRRFEDIAPAFARTAEMAGYSFFRMEPVALNAQRLEEWSRPVDGVYLNERANALQEAVLGGNGQEAAAILEEVFLLRLKDSYQFRRVEDALAYFKNVMRTAGLIWDLTWEEELDQLCDLNRYITIEDCCQTLVQTAEELCKRMGGVGRRFSRLTKEAVYFIHAHYMEELSLGDIARYVNVVPTYLSSVFRREMGQTVNNYLVDLRMKKAREILSSTNLKVAEVAQAVGIRNTPYFSACFKKEVGLSPNDYREAHRVLPGGGEKDRSKRG